MSIYGPSGSSSLVTPALAALSQDTNRQVDSVALDYLLIEAVRTLGHSSKIATARIRATEEEMISEGLLPPPAPLPAVPMSIKADSVKDAVASQREARIAEEVEEALRLRLEGMGAVVGSNLAERYSKDKPRFQDTLDTVKFICKDLWTAMWDKQVDNLRTNHRGVYVLQDNAFKPLLRMSSPDGSADALRRAKIYLAFPVGVIRGALSRFGLNAVVTSEAVTLPQCTFQVKLPKGQ
ncbi:Trafficking protein particle complex subunit 33 [Tulasnella sp. UAMH 9824]|nr:Trafficking protein particle complex subunit 33 [Tulasnella sp. UAMH 9824]